VVTRNFDIAIRGDAKSALAAFAATQKSAQATSTRVGRAMKVVGGLGLVAAAGAVGSIKAFADFDAKMTESLAIMGDVSETMRGKMSDAAREVGRTTKFSATEAAEAYFFLASAGMDAEQSIAALPQVALFAQAGQFDLARATDLLTDSQSALGMASEDAGENLRNMTRISDVLVGANTLANASVEQFATALTSKAGEAMDRFNMDLEEGVSILALFADQGLKGSNAGTIFARTLEGLEQQARTNADEFKELGISVFDSAGELRPMADIIGDMEQAFDGMSTEQRTAALAQLGFNERARRGIGILLGNSEQLREYESDLRGMGGVTQEVADKQMETLQEKLGLLRDRMVDVGIEIGEQLTPALESLSEWLLENTELAAKLATAMSGLLIVRMIAGSWAFLTGPLALAGKALFFLASKAVIPAVVAGIQALAVALGVGVGVAAGIVLAIVAVGVAIVIFREEIWAAIQAVGRFITRIPGYIGDALGWLGDFMSELPGMIWRQLVKLPGIVLDALGMLAGVGGALLGTLGSALAGLAGVILGALVTGITDGIPEVARAFFRLVARLPRMLVDLYEGILDAAFGAAAAVADGLGKAIPAVAGWVGDLAVSVGRWLRDTLWPAVRDFFIALPGRIAGALAVALPAIASFFVGLPGMARDALVGAWPALRDFFVRLPGRARDALVAAWPVVTAFFLSVPALIMGAITGAAAWLVDVGSDILGGLLDGIKKGAEHVWDWFRNMPARLLDFFMDRGWLLLPGGIIIAGLLRGLQNAWPLITAFFGRLPGDIIRVLGALGGLLLDLGRGAMRLMWRGLVRGGEIILRFARDLPGWILDRIGDLISALPGLGRAAITGLASGVVAGAPMVLRGVGTLLTNAAGLVVDLGIRLVQLGRDLILGLLRGIVSVGGSLLSGVMGLVTGLRDLVVRGFNLLRSRAIDIVLGLRDMVIRGFRTLRDRVVDIALALRDAAVRAVRALRDRLVSIVGDLRDTFIRTMRALRDRVVAIFTGLRDRFVELAGSVRDRVVSAVTGLRDTVRDRVQQMRDWAVSRFRGMRDTAAEVATNLRDRVVRTFRDLRDTLRSVFTRIREVVEEIWSSIARRVRNAINRLIRPMNRFLKRLWGVLEKVPGLKEIIGSAPQIEELAQGGQVPGAVDPNSYGPFTTAVPRAIVGEGGPHPEYVIPTDPKFRGRATALTAGLMQKLGMSGMVPGMFMGGVVGAAKDFFSKSASMIGRGVLTAAWAPVNEAFKAALKVVPTTFWARAKGHGIRRTFGDWIRGGDDAQPELTKQVSGSPGKGGGPAGVQQWRGVGLQALQITGQSPAWIGDLLTQMQHESGGNPTIVNMWDSNWVKGTPSVGLMQVIGPTYRAHRHPLFDQGPYLYGTSVNPLSNILAAIRWTLHAYGSLARWRAGGFKGYQEGGIVRESGGYTHAGEMVLTRRDQTNLFKQIRSGTPRHGDVTIHMAEGAIQVTPAKGMSDTEAKRLGGRIGQGFWEHVETQRVKIQARMG
jgi:TP901 family phage tail tape measure protein